MHQIWADHVFFVSTTIGNARAMLKRVITELTAFGSEFKEGSLEYITHTLRNTPKEKLISDRVASQTARERQHMP